MPKPVCPQCGDPETTRTRRRLWERVLTLAAVYPFQCASCGHRFRVRQRGVRYVRYLVGGFYPTSPTGGVVRKPRQKHHTEPESTL